MAEPARPAAAAAGTAGGGGRAGRRDGEPPGVDALERSWLVSAVRPGAPQTGPQLRVADLFSGCGGLTLGLYEAARALGMRFRSVLALDFSRSALAAYTANFGCQTPVCSDVTAVFDGEVHARATAAETAVAAAAGPVDVLVGGPPCQGHSDLNNRTRRSDAKNRLFAAMVRAAQVLEPSHLLIENVPGALRDKNSVVQRSAEALSALGYEITLGVLDLTGLGVPQRRRRLVLLGSRSRRVGLGDIATRHRRTPRTVRWAIADLQDLAQAPARLIDEPARSAPATRRRMDYLFDHSLFDLPDAQRPPCHAQGTHTYRSIYGRLRWDAPAQTITTGFYSMCMGRYVHPSRRRTITAHEAARLQYFPDWFDFGADRRSDLAAMIGNAVPMRLSYAAAVEWFR